MPIVFAHAVLQPLHQGLQAVKVPDTKTAMRDAVIRRNIVVEPVRQYIDVLTSDLTPVALRVGPDTANFKACC